MKKTCIMCSALTGTREHIFPAALGGRRTNKGIYCGQHNNQLGPLATTLSGQLRAINALLGVQPDHGNETVPLIANNPVDGHDYAVTGQKTENMEPLIVKDVALPDGSRAVEARFSSEQQLQDWLATQRATGSQARPIGPRTEGFTVFAEPYRARLTLGGSDGLKAVAYVALTFLAHHFPAIARQPNTEDFKNFVLGVCDAPQPVWWNFDPPKQRPTRAAVPVWPSRRHRSVGIAPAGIRTRFLLLNA
ncbi:MAG: hypothetical protein ACYDEV_00280 [Acidiferrobacter sp.]